MFSFFDQMLGQSCLLLDFVGNLVVSHMLDSR